LKDVSKTGDTASSTGATSLKDTNQNDQYVKQLVALRAISFNLDLFSDDAYKILHAANTDIPPEEKGRHNPFAPVEVGDGEYVDSASTTTTILPRANAVPPQTTFQITSSTTPNRLPGIPKNTTKVGR
jgi:hypothetical protein